MRLIVQLPCYNEKTTLAMTVADIPREIAGVDSVEILIDHFSPVKKRLRKLGSFVVRLLSNTDIPDAVSGFRAFSRDAAMRTNIVSSHSYTVETIIQAGNKKLTVPCER